MRALTDTIARGPFLSKTLNSGGGSNTWSVAAQHSESGNSVHCNDMHLALSAPGEDKALTRFYLDTTWNGEEMLLQSRAMDETGYVQRTKAQLREVRGLNSIYHNNCIQTWHVKPNGEAENVEVS